MSYLKIKNNSESLLNQITSFNKELNTWDYGFLHNGKKSLNFDYYKTISPQDFEKHKIGVCWDYVEYEARKLKSYGMKCVTTPLTNDKEFSLYYIVHTTEDGIDPTHTWIGFRLNKNIYSFESSWGKYQGIHKFANEKIMIDTYRNWHSHSSDIKSKIHNCYVFKYNPKIKFNKTPIQFMNGIHSTGKCYFSTNTNHQKLDYHL